jgi:eukaryotic-like serine/threonine-protein kinase
MAATNDGPTEPEIEEGIPRPGYVIAKKYRVERVIGRGGMGVVVAAEHITLRQRVAVKFLLPAAILRAGAPERFLREARSAVAIQSEHVARVIDVGTLTNGAPYMVMEYLTGTDLGEVLRARGPLPVDEAIDYVLQASEALAEAHALGIIHRDLKPANLFLTTRPDGSSLVKVLDFGLSKATRPDASGAMDLSLTASNTLLGSPHYMSPEQVRSLKTIDARTDIWALGVILFQLLTARRPFDEDSLGGLFIMIGADPPAALRSFRGDLPLALEALINRCLEKEPSARVQTVAELARGLLPFAAPGSRVSVERILRVMSDDTPLPAPPPRLSSPSFTNELPAASGSAPAPAMTPAGLTASQAPSTLDTRMPGASGAARPGSVAPTASRPGIAPVLVAGGGLKSDSALASTMAQVVEVVAAPPHPQRRPADRGRNLVTIIFAASIGLVILAAIIGLTLRGSSPERPRNGLPPSPALGSSPR